MWRRLPEICAAFLKLGLTSFGGPIAHLGYLRAEFVAKRRWLDDPAYGDLVALCEFLPGPASSQAVFALGKLRAGIPGALAAAFCFTMPSAVLMIAFGYGIASIANIRSAGWLHGLMLAAVAVVAQAVWGMGRTLCPGRARLSMCLAAAAFLLVFPGAFGQIGIIALGALLGWWLFRANIPAANATSRVTGKSHVAAVAALALFALLLIVMPILASVTRDRRIREFDGFYRSGALVFGGGHVVLPLLRAEVVPRGWINDDRFLAG
jgi:chromate transporter